MMDESAKSSRRLDMDWVWEVGDLVEYSQLGTHFTARLTEYRFSNCWAAEVVQVFTRKEPWNAQPGELITVVRGGAKKVGVGVAAVLRHPELARMDQYLEEYYTLEPTGDAVERREYQQGLFRARKAREAAPTSEYPNNDPDDYWGGRAEPGGWR